MRKYLGKLKALLLMFLVPISVLRPGRFHWQKNNLQYARPTGKRKVIVLLVDSLLSDAIERLIAEGNAPALAFFMQNGVYRRDMISSFPTMSVTIDSTFLTGTYADNHQVPGLLWFHADEQRMIDYGDGLRIIWKPGLVQWFTDSFYNLNQLHLSSEVTTLHENLAASSISTGSINAMVYRGARDHHFGIKGMYSVKMQAPDVLALGALAQVSNENLPIGPFNSLGMNNDYTIKSIISLLKQDRLPMFTIAYFSDLDSEVHKYGPAHIEGVKKLDKQLQELLNVFGSWEEALHNHLFILMGDSGVTATKNEKTTALINLEHTFSGFQSYRLGHKRNAGDDIALAVNGRMCYVYALSDRVSITMLVDRLKNEKRIDLIAWKENDWILVQQAEKRMGYKSGTDWSDSFGQSWDLQGDISVMQLELRKEEGKLLSPAFPDGLRRLESVLHSHKGRYCVITARAGFEFSADGAPNHPKGGNHGSLHAIDSLFPILVASDGEVPPPPARLVDVKQYILSLLQ